MERILTRVGVPQAFHLHIKQVTKFGITGGFNFILFISLYSLAKDIVGFPLLTSLLIANTFALICVFIMNMHWTFRHSGDGYMRCILKYLMVYAGSYVLNVGGTWAFVQYAGLWDKLAIVIMVGICAIWNYCGMHFVVFRD